MKNVFLIFIVFFSASPAIVAQSANVSVYNANATVQRTPEPPKTKITGRAFYEDTGKPLRRGIINLVKIEERSVYDDVKEKSLEKVYASDAVTDDNGEFFIEKVAAGEYYPNVDVAGVLNPKNYDNQLKKDYDLKLEKLDQLFEKIVIVEGVKEQQVLIKVRRGAAIGGRIAYADGDAVIGAEVETLQKGKYGLEIVSSTKSDDRGFYRFSSLPSGEYIIRISQLTFRKSQNEYGYVDYSSLSNLRTYYGDSANVGEAKPIEIGAAEEKSEINITIAERETFAVSGKVVSKTTKSPVKYARVSFERKEEEYVLSYRNRSASSKTVLTDETGKFTVDDLPTGDYIFTISPPNEAGNAYSSVQEAKTAKPAKEIKYAETKEKIVVKDKNLENVTLELPVAARLSGVLFFENKREIKDVYLSIYDEEKSVSGYTSFSGSEYAESRKTKPAQWDFTVSNLAEGNYFPYVGQSDGLQDFYIKSITVGGKDWLSSSLEIKENSEIKDVRIVLASDVGTIKGKIESGDSKLLESLRVILIPVNNPNVRSSLKYIEVSENGEFSAKSAPGDYFLVVHPLNFLRSKRDLKHEEWVKEISKDAETIAVKPNETVAISLKK